jgi:hypothetical protein
VVALQEGDVIVVRSESVRVAVAGEGSSGAVRRSRRAALLAVLIVAAFAVLPAQGFAAAPAEECIPETENKEHDGQGAVVDWGWNANNDLAGGYEDERELSPVSVLEHTPDPEVEALEDVKQVATGAGASFALRADCTLWAWGGDTGGQLGNGKRTPPKEEGRGVARNLHLSNKLLQKKDRK